MYLHVSVAICLYLSVYYRTSVFRSPVCMYMQVFVCICMYPSISDQYLHVLQVLDHWGTETTTESPKHLLVTLHPEGPTQGTPGHAPYHFLTPSQSPPSTRFFDFANIFVLWCILPWQQNQPGSSREAQTWPNRSPTRIVQGALECAEIEGLFSLFWCTKDGPLAQFSIRSHMVANG